MGKQRNFFKLWTTISPHNRFKYVSNDYFDGSLMNHDNSKTVSLVGTATRDYMDASTATMNNLPLVERSVLYQLKSFGSSTNLSPLQLPPTGKIRQLATQGTHFVVVMYGKLSNEITFPTSSLIHAIHQTVQCTPGVKATRVSWVTTRWKRGAIIRRKSNPSEGTT